MVQCMDEKQLYYYDFVGLERVEMNDGGSL